MIGDISRQRTWEIPLPIFYCKNCEKEYVTPDSLDKVQKYSKRKRIQMHGLNYQKKN